MTTLATRRDVLKQQLPVVHEIYARHGFDRNRIDQLAPLIEHFEIRIPLIGAFSSGKSSLLNALLGEKILATDVTPETAVPVELRYGPERLFHGCFPDGRRMPLDEADLRENRLAELLPQGWVEAQFPNQALAKRPQLVLVDLPGWDSGITAHGRVIDDYVDRSLAYGVVVSVEDGALRDTLRRALRELAIAQMPVIVIVSKADKRPSEDVQAVAKQLHGQIAELMGRDPLALAVVSVRKKILGPLEEALDQLQSKASEIFEVRVVKAYGQELNHAVQLLGMIANQENPDAEKLQAQIEKLEQDVRKFDERLQQETQALEAQIGPIQGTIRLRVERALADRLDTFTQRVFDGIDISDDVLGTVRLVISEAIRQEFHPALQRYLERLVDSLPNSLNFDFDLSSLYVEKSGSNETGQPVGKTLLIVIGSILSQITHPIAKMIAPLALLLSEIFNKSDPERQKVQEARQRERVRSQVRKALDDAVRQIDAHLHPLLVEKVRAARDEVARDIDAQSSEIKKTLDTLQSALRQGEAKTAELRTRAQADLGRLNTLLAELPPAA